MIRVTKRPSDPEFGLFDEWQRRASVARERLISDWKEAGYPTSWKPDINKALYKELRDVFLYTAFHLKCGYCECKLGHNFAVQVEHYRPKGGLSDENDTAHPGYFWLAYEWWNLIPTCNNCNNWHTDPRSRERNAGKSTAFPIRGIRVFEPSADPDHWQEELAGEDPLLLNPYFHNPTEHIDFDPVTGAPIPISSYGRATIEICDLKRDSLCESRRDRGRDVVTELLLRLFRDHETIDSVVPASCEYSFWLKRLLQYRLASACVEAGMTPPQRTSIRAGVALEEPDEVLVELLERGEGPGLEFKSSARWDMRQGKINRALEEVIVKTVAGFLNADGGVLLIGIDDSGRIMGLRHDYGTLHRDRQDRDGFEAFLQNLLLDACGKDLSPFIRVHFHRAGGEEVCRVTATPAPHAVYVSDGTGGEHLYVRSGNTTQRLSTREAVEYVRVRWT